MLLLRDGGGKAEIEGIAAPRLAVPEYPMLLPRRVAQQGGKGVSTAPTQYRQRGGKEKRKDGNIALLIALTASSTVNGCVITSPKQGRCRRCCSPLHSPGLRSCTHILEQLGDICVTRDPGAAPPCARGHLAHEPTAKPRWINHTNDHTEPSTSSLAQTVCHTSKQKECYC